MDRAKRAQMGELAARYGDLLVLTDEDPRREKSEAILTEIAAGVWRERPALKNSRQLRLVPDRRRAIHTAIIAADIGDTVLLLGKGHERSIAYADGEQPWNEIDVARQVLDKLGFGGEAN